MAYEFKKLSAVEAVEAPADTANVLIEEDGVIKKTPSRSFASGGGSGVYRVPVTLISEKFTTTADHQAAVDAFYSGALVYMLINNKEIAYLNGCKFDTMDEWYIITFDYWSGKTRYTCEWYPNGVINAIKLTFPATS